MAVAVPPRPATASIHRCASAAIPPSPLAAYTVGQLLDELQRRGILGLLCRGMCHLGVVLRCAGDHPGGIEIAPQLLSRLCGFLASCIGQCEGRASVVI